MPRDPLVWAPVKIGIVRAIRDAGGDPDAALAAVGLTRADLEDPDCYIPIRQSLALPAAAAAETGDPFFGLHWGERDRPEHLGVLAYVTTNSPTVRVALSNLVRYISIVTQGVDLWTTDEPPLASLRYRVRDPSIPDLRHNDEYVVAFGQNLLRAVTEPEWRPREVHFRHPAPSDLAEYRRVFGAPVRFEQPQCALVFDSELLDRANAKADPQLLPILETHAGDLLQRMPPLEDVAGSVRDEIREALMNGVPSLESIAEQLSMSSRTLQRRLGETGWQFKSLVEETRRQLSLDYLDREQVPITEIAFRAGYSELSAFDRAFRRWTGKTPHEYRKRSSR